MTDDHVAQLHKKIEHLKFEFQATAEEVPFDQLLLIIHRPGWTTIAEGALTQTVVDNLAAQISAIRLANQQLLSAAQEVGATAAKA